MKEMTNKEAIEVLKTYDMSEDNDDEEFKGAVARAIKVLERDRWIPVEEAVPKSMDYVLVSINGQIGDTTYIHAITGGSFWEKDGWELVDLDAMHKGKYTVEAWRPAPEIYGGSEDEG